MSILKITRVKAGMELAEPVLNPQGQVLFEEGDMISEKHLKAFKAWGVTEVNIKCEEGADIPIMDDVATLVRSIKKISSLPTIFTKVNELINDPTSCAADLGRVIKKDQALTSRLLRLANSAFYGFPGRIETATRAITIIGFKQLKDLVLAVSVRSIFNPNNAFEKK